MAGIADLIAEAAGGAAVEDLLPADPKPEASAEKPAAEPAKAAADPEELIPEGAEQGRPAIPFPRFAEVNGKRKAAEARAAELEGVVKASESKVQAFEKLYSGFKDPLAQMQEDADFAAAVWDLREDPAVKAALAVIQKHHQGKVKAVEQRTEKPADSKAAPAADPRVEALYTEKLRDRTSEILSGAKIRPELHGMIQDHVAKNAPNPTADAVRTVIREMIAANKWTKDFLTVPEPAKGRRSVVPTPSGLGGSAPAAKPAATQTQQTQQKTERPKSVSAMEVGRRDRLHDLIRQRGL